MKMWINFSENRSDFPKNFLNFRLDTNKKHGIINLSSNCNKSHASVVPNDSEVALLEEGENLSFQPFFSLVLLHNQIIMYLNFHFFHT